MDLGSQRAEERDHTVRGTQQESGASTDQHALLVVGFGLMAAGVVAPCPHACADGECTDHGGDSEEVDAAHHILEDWQAGQAALVWLNPRAVGELDDLVGEIYCELQFVLLHAEARAGGAAVGRREEGKSRSDDSAGRENSRFPGCEGRDADHVTGVRGIDDQALADELADVFRHGGRPLGEDEITRLESIDGCRLALLDLRVRCSCQGDPRSPV